MPITVDVRADPSIAAVSAQLEITVANLVAAINRGLEDAQQEIAVELVRNMKRRAPVRTGMLRDSIRSVTFADGADRVIGIQSVFYARPVNAVTQFQDLAVTDTDVEGIIVAAVRRALSTVR